MKAKPDFEKIKQERVEVKAGSDSEKVSLFKREVEEKVEEGFSEEAARNFIVAERYKKWGELISSGAIEARTMSEKSEKGKYENAVLFYNTGVALRIKEAIKEGLTNEELKRLQEQCQASYENVEIEENSAEDEITKTAILKFYTKNISDKDKKDKNLIKDLEGLAESAAKQVKVLKMLYERVKDKLAILESSPQRDEKLQEILSADPKFGADLLWIAEINEHLRNEEARCVKETAAPQRFAEANGGIEKIIGHGMGGTLAIFVGRVFKIAWQSAFLKGQKADKKVQHFFKEITKESLELFSKEAYYGGALVGKAGRAGVAGAGKMAKFANRQSIKEGIAKAEKSSDETATLLRKVKKEAINDRSMDPTN